MTGVMRLISFIVITLFSYVVSAQDESSLTSDFTSTVIDTPSPSLYRPYQSQLDNHERSRILLSLVAPKSAPAEFGSVDLIDFSYTTLFGDVSAGSSAGIVDGVGTAARIREVRCFTQTENGETVYFGDRFVVRKIDRASGNVSSVLGNPNVNPKDNFNSSWEAITFSNINGIIYEYEDGKHIIYVNTESVGLVKLDLNNKKFSVVVPLKEISSQPVNDYGADLIMSPDRNWLYMKVNQGINRYNLPDMDNIDFHEARWISSNDPNATCQETNYQFGDIDFGRLGLSPTGSVLTFVDHTHNYFYFIDTRTREVNRICDNTGFSDGNSSACAFSDIYSSLWIPDDRNDLSNHYGKLYVFHYHEVSKSQKNNYVAVATVRDPVPPTTTITTTPKPSPCDSRCGLALGLGLGLPAGIVIAILIILIIIRQCCPDRWSRVCKCWDRVCNCGSSASPEITADIYVNQTEFIDGKH